MNGTDSADRVNHRQLMSNLDTDFDIVLDLARLPLALHYPFHRTPPSRLLGSHEVD